MRYEIILGISSEASKETDVFLECGRAKLSSVMYVKDVHRS